jgi:predicted DNA-binding transcriptional regulator YafY
LRPTANARAPETPRDAEEGIVTKRTFAKAAAQPLTALRAARLCKLLRLVRNRPQTRSTLTSRLKLDVRGFYRDLEWLRTFGIAIVLEAGRYRLDEDADNLIARLPLPDPQLNLGEAMQLAKGRTAAHRKLKKVVAAIVR